MNRPRLLSVMVFLAALSLAAACAAPAKELCFIPDSQGRNYSVECGGVPNAHPHEWSGYNTDALPCNSTGIPGYAPCSVVPRGAQPFYGWTLSSSPTDPYAWQGPLTGPPGLIYLHLVCVDVLGLQAAAFEISGDLLVYAFTTMNGFLNAGDASNLLLATACVTSSTTPVVAGVFTTEWATSAEDSWAASSWGRVKSLYAPH